LARLLAPPLGPDELGRLGDYRVLDLLSRGGMGVVLAAEDSRLRRRVALKMMRPEVAARPEAKARFLREARAAAALQHDHIVPIYHVGEQDGVPFMVLPLLAGESLEDRLRRESPQPAAEVARIGREAAEGLAAAHAAGLVHRDVKPGNLWLEVPTGRVKILDFGLAREVAADGDGALTRAGAVLGTPAYMSPEQADGQPLDGRSDLFSLGCVLYHIATGKPPFQGKTLTAMLRAVAERHPPPPRDVRPELSAALSDLIERLLEKDPNRRPASAREVADTLAASGPGAVTTVDAPPGAATTLVPPAAPVRSPGRRAWLAAAVGLLLVGGGLAAWLGRAGPPALKGVLDVQVWPRGEARRPGKRLHEPGVLPLKPGDLLRIEAALSRPAYLYLVWLDSSGRATPLWPWVNSDWRNRPADRDRARRTLSVPEAAGAGAPLDPGPSGIEALLLLARDEPLPAAEDLAQRCAGWPQQPGLDPLRLRLAAWLENGEPVRDEPERAPINLGKAQALEDPVWRARALLRDGLRPLFPYTRAVCFTFQGQ
jgi:hypothetical protein